MMLMPDCIDDVVLIVRENYLYDEAHQKLFKHIKQIHEAQRTVDMTLLVNSLKAAGEFEAVGGGSYIAKIINAVPHAGNAVYYAEIVREKWARRETICIATDALRDSYDDRTPSKEIIAKAESQLFDVLDEGTGVSGQVQHASETLANCFAVLEARATGEIVGGLQMGFHPLDDKLGGLHRGELIIVAGRPSQGKSALGMQIVSQSCIEHQSMAMYVSLEMSAQDVAERLICQRARSDVYRVHNGFLGAAERAALVEASADLAHSHFYVVDQPCISVTQISAMARRHKRTKGLDILCIDYLGLLEADDPRLPRQEQVAAMWRQLKLTARSLDIAVVALAQLNRNNEQGVPRVPRISEIRESGAAEQDADVILFTHRPALYDKEKGPKNPGELETSILSIGKQRHGPVGEIEVYFKKESALFLPKADQPDHFPAEAGMGQNYGSAGGSLPQAGGDLF